MYRLDAFLGVRKKHFVVISPYSAFPILVIEKQRQALALNTMVKASVLASHCGRMTVKEADVQCLRKLDSVADGSVCVPPAKKARDVD